MTTPTISIILPVYNSEKYIRACLDSILAQTFSDFEVILVDDGSPDNAGLICDEYAKKDQRFHVFHQENKGVSAARNKGLENSKGEWITFIDPDDLVKPNYLKNLYDAIAPDIDLVISGHERIKEGATAPFVTFKNIPNKFSRDELFHKTNAHLVLATWAKLIRKSLLDEYKITFDKDLSSSEDVIFYMDFIAKAKNIKLTSAVDYIYINRQGSLVSRPRSFKRIYNETHIIKKAKYLAFLKGEKIPPHAIEYFLRDITNAIHSMYTAPYKLPKAERLAKLERIFKNEADVIDNLPAKNRLKRMRHNLPALDRFLDSKHNGFLKYVLKLKIKLSNTRKAIKGIFVKKQKTKTIEI